MAATSGPECRCDQSQGSDQHHQASGEHTSCMEAMLQEDLHLSGCACGLWQTCTRARTPTVGRGACHSRPPCSRPLQPLQCNAKEGTFSILYRQVATCPSSTALGLCRAEQPPAGWALLVRHASPLAGRRLLLLLLLCRRRRHVSRKFAAISSSSASSGATLNSGMLRVVLQSQTGRRSTQHV